MLRYFEIVAAENIVQPGKSTNAKPFGMIGDREIQRDEVLALHGTSKTLTFFMIQSSI